MDKCKVEKFSLTTIENLLSKSDLDAVRLRLSSVVGLAVTVRGKFQSAGSLMVCLSDCRLACRSNENAPKTQKEQRNNLENNLKVSVKSRGE